MSIMPIKQWLPHKEMKCKTHNSLNWVGLSNHNIKQYKHLNEITAYIIILIKKEMIFTKVRFRCFVYFFIPRRLRKNLAKSYHNKTQTCMHYDN